ncbi:MAG: DUF484 family protein [Phenylobacterium sp.]
MDARARAEAEAPGAEAVRRYLIENPEFLKDDAGLLAQLGLSMLPSNVVAFAPAALARVHEAHERESEARRLLEATAQENFQAQAQTHGAVIDLLEARNHADLARRVDDLAQWRFGLVGGAVALEGPGRTPAGWRTMPEGQVDALLGGTQELAFMGFNPAAVGLFSERHDQVFSMALMRMAIWEPARQGLIAFASHEPEGFTPDMGHELVAFLARVVERTAERWPVL